MSIISLKKIREVSNKTKETHIIDLGKYIDKSLDGLCIPIKIKSLEESINLKQNYKINKDNLSIDYKVFTRMPKPFREMYMKTDMYRQGITENTYFQLCKLNEDESKIEKNKYRERLFNIVIHLDMDYEIEEGITMWEDAGLKKNDYNGLVNIFSDIIKFEKHLDILDIIIDKLKSGITNEDEIKISIFDYDLRKTIESIEDPVEKKIFLDNFKKVLENQQKESEKLKNENSKE